MNQLSIHLVRQSSFQCESKYFKVIGIALGPAYRSHIINKIKVFNQLALSKGIFLELLLAMMKE